MESGGEVVFGGVDAMLGRARGYVRMYHIDSYMELKLIFYSYGRGVSLTRRRYSDNQLILVVGVAHSIIGSEATPRGARNDNLDFQFPYKRSRLADSGRALWSFFHFLRQTR